jgi:hypothetical protein
MFQRGCPVGVRPPCPQPHTRNQDEAKLCLGLRTKVNGMPIYDLCCADCGRRIRHLSAKAFNELVKRGKTVEYVESGTDDTPVCVVRGCTTVGYEYHHFAPSNVFGFQDATRWPYLRLCKPHHTAWHQTMSGFRWDRRELPEAVEQERMRCLIYKCSQPGTHLLRLSPKSRFSHSDVWPVVPVCGPHYLEYHQTMDGYQWSRKAESSEFSFDMFGEWFDQHRYWESLEPYLRGAR